MKPIILGKTKTGIIIYSNLSSKDIIFTKDSLKEPLFTINGNEVLRLFSGLSTDQCRDALSSLIRLVTDRLEKTNNKRS